MHQQMRRLTTPAAPDQIKQRATLVSHLTIITDLGCARLGAAMRRRNLRLGNLATPTLTDASSEEFALAASGKQLLPLQPLNERAFWSIGVEQRRKSEIEAAAARAVSNDRDEREAGLTKLSSHR